jgi:hypothetical protein
VRRTASFEYDPNDIPKLKDIVQLQMTELQDRAYQKGVDAECERIIKIIEDSVGRMTADVIINLIKGEQK